MVAAVNNRSLGTSHPSLATRRLSRLVVLVIGLLGLQFALGMFLNLFVAFTPGGNVASGLPVSDVAVFYAHQFVGIGAFAIAIAIAVLLVRTRKPGLIGSAWASAAWIVVAGIAGGYFVYQGQVNVFSYLMAIGFILALAFQFEVYLLLDSPTGPRSAVPALP